FLTLSLVGNADLSIDRYANVTIDKAESHSRFYSAKAPGLSLSNHLRRPTKYRVQGLLVFEISAWTTLSSGVLQCHPGRRERIEPTTHIRSFTKATRSLRSANKHISQNAGAENT